MTILDYTLLALLGIAAAAAIRSLYRAKKSGKCLGCSGTDCACCMKKEIEKNRKY